MSLKSPIEKITDNALETYQEELSKKTEETGFSLAQALGTVGKSTEEQKKERAKILAERRSQINFLLDGAKLNQSVQNMELIGEMTNTLLDPEVLQRVKDNVKSAYDYNQLAAAQKTFIKNMQELNVLDTVDASGTSARLNLAVSLKNSDGSSTQVVVQTK